MEQEKQDLVLIDGNAILHRAYHALPPLTTRSGELVNAVYGFATMLLKILQEMKPKYIAVAFDTAKPNFRHQEYVGYQAHRPRTDAELVGQIEKVYELVRAFNIPIFAVEGFEADDVIGTLAVQAPPGKVNEVVIVTGDRDLMQLVTEKIKLFMPTRGLSEGQLVGEKEVKEKMGVSPGKIVDYKGLVGDQSDNYPGVPGIGPKTAVGLLEKFGRMENIYRSLDKVESKTVLAKLTEGAESAALSKKLATILKNVPVTLDLEKCLAKDYDKGKVVEFFKELGFRSLVNRLSGSAQKENEEEEHQPSLF
ncbi:MAG TPA: 5'-3' exonuclease H3TH domain-containing protein [Patescibacteria group bacterium]|nr:5'-3' exonuclease H3TH domain-containing protein [Patescibacteria group bacterium]